MQDIQKWNDVASDYQKVYQLGINEYSKKMLVFLLEKDMLRPGCRVIDVGCGVGKYGTYFATLGCDVTLSDISAGMLELARQNMENFTTPWTTLECDFETVDPVHPVFEEGFDLGISTMCPAIHNVQTVRKLSDMIHGWCFVTHFTSWKEPLRERFYEKIGVSPQEDMNRFSRHIDGLLQAVKDAGFTPQICHVPYNWSDNRTATEAAEYLLNRLEGIAITDSLREKAIIAATELCNENGVFVDAVNTTVAWVYWESKEESR